MVKVMRSMKIFEVNDWVFKAKGAKDVGFGDQFAKHWSLVTN